MSYTLLTGSTGLIGRFLLRDFTSQQDPIAVLVRDSAAADSAQRIEEVVDSISAVETEFVTSPRISMPVCISSDLLREDLGLSDSDAAWIKENVSSVVHCAGNVSFQTNETPAGPMNTNINGTRNLALFCKSAGIDDFSYVSTSFVSGDRKGTIREQELDLGQNFDSNYERSKFLAEKLLKEVGFKRLNIFRPCSVTGDLVTGHTSTFHGVYWFAQFTSLARFRSGADAGQPWHHDVRIFKSGKELHHLIPVDAVSRAIVELHSRNDLPGSTYHLTPPTAYTLAELEMALADYYCYHGVTFAGYDCDSQLPPNDMEQLFYDGLKASGHRYLDGDPVFDCSNTISRLPWWKEIQVDHSYLLKIFAFAESKRFGRGRRNKPLATA